MKLRHMGYGLLAGLVLAVPVFAAPESVPIKVSVIPSISAPKTQFVAGADLGLLATRTETVYGFQWGTFFTQTVQPSYGVQMGIFATAGDYDGAIWGVVSLAGRMRGYQAGMICSNNGIIGYQTGLVTKTNELEGMQFGAVNFAESVSGFQLGLMNYTRKMHGLQIGLVNIIENSTMPIMVLANGVF